MKLFVGCNWDPSLVHRLSAFPEVVDFSGLLRRSVVGAGSAAYLAPEASRMDVESFVRDAHRASRTVTVILDAPNMEAREWEPEVHQQILEEFGWLESIKVDAVELAIPYLVELVHRRFPKLGIRVSPTTRAATVDTVTFLQEMGASCVGVEPMVQRRFEVLKVMAAQSGIPLFVEVTNGILRGSPSYGNFDLAWTNSLMSSHRFEPDVFSELSKTYNHAYDDGYKVKHPVEILRTHFVRPEDVHLYESIGIEHFKLDTALLTTDDIVRRVEAYVARTYDGNLTHLANLFYFGNRYQSEVATPYQAPTFPGNPPQAITRFFQLLGDKGIIDSILSVDNARLHGLLDHVVGGRCDPVACSECQRFADAAIHVRPDAAAAFVDALEQYRRCLFTGEYLP